MKKPKVKILVVLVLFFGLISSHIFNTGKGHVGVVKDNIALNNELDGVKKDNKALKTQISTLQDSVSTLVEENNELAQQTNKQDENKDIVENIKPKLKIKKNEKSTVTNNNDASSGFSINAISDSESD
jgi:uncharacterized protein YlxW (UPF0749 family)